MPTRKEEVLDVPQAQRVAETIQRVSKETQTPIMRFSDYGNSQVEALSTGIATLDLALGIGGFPRGRIIEIYGSESGGKTTLAFSALCQAQKIGAVAYIDAEHALDPTWAKACGIDVPNLVISQPDTAETTLTIIDELTKSGLFSMIVLDSIAAMIPEAEFHGEIGENHVGLAARLMSQALRKVSMSAQRTQTIVLMINQLRDKIGVIYGSNETTTGGKALRFYASVRLDMRPTEKIGSKEEYTGRRFKVKVVKNKVAPPFRETEIQIDFKGGVNTQVALLEAGVELGVLQKKGNWIAFGEQQLGNGQRQQLETLDDNPTLAGMINEQVQAAIRARVLGEDEL